MRMETSDENLVNLAQSGNAEAFGDLLERHYDLIFRLGFRMLGNRADAEDLAQDICAGLPVRLQKFEARAKFTTWLYRVTMNAAVDRLRKRKTQAKAGDGWGDVEQMNRATATEQAEEIAWLYATMQTLTPQLRDTLALVLGEELTHAEAGEVLEVSEGTISWRMSEIKKQLRAQARKEERIK